MGVSTVGVSLLATARYPQHLFAGKARCNRIKDLQVRTFDTEKINRTATRSPGFEMTSEGSIAFATVAQ